MKVVVWKDGSWKPVEHSHEYENDTDWLVTIPVAPEDIARVSQQLKDHERIVSAS